MFTKTLYLCLFSLVFSACTHASKVSSDQEVVSELVKQASIIEEENLQYRVRVERGQKFLSNNYSQLIKIEPKNWSEARVIFDGLSKILFYVKDDRFMPYFEKVYWVLDKDNFDRDHDRERIFEYYSRNRQVDLARKFVSKMQEWQKREFVLPPEIVKSKNVKEGPALLSLKNKNTFVVENFPLESYTGMIILGTPNCGWTSKALKAIFNPKNNKVVDSKNVTLVTPQEVLPVNEIELWNRANPQTPYRPVYKESAFLPLSFNSFPYFYFLKKGKVEYEFSGWADDGQMKFIKKGLAKIKNAGAKTVKE